MKATIEQISLYLDFPNWKYEMDTKSDRILTHVKTLNPKKVELWEKLLLILQETLPEGILPISASDYRPQAHRN